MTPGEKLYSDAWAEYTNSRQGIRGSLRGKTRTIGRAWSWGDKKKAGQVALGVSLGLAGLAVTAATFGTASPAGVILAAAGFAVATGAQFGISQYNLKDKPKTDKRIRDLVAKLEQRSFSKTRDDYTSEKDALKYLRRNAHKGTRRALIHWRKAIKGYGEAQAKLTAFGQQPAANCDEVADLLKEVMYFVHHLDKTRLYLLPSLVISEAFVELYVKLKEWIRPFSADRINDWITRTRIAQNPMQQGAARLPQAREPLQCDSRNGRCYHTAYLFGGGPFQDRAETLADVVKTNDQRFLKKLREAVHSGDLSELHIPQVGLRAVQVAAPQQLPAAAAQPAAPPPPAAQDPERRLRAHWQADAANAAARGRAGDLARQFEDDVARKFDQPGTWVRFKRNVKGWHHRRTKGEAASFWISQVLSAGAVAGGGVMSEFANFTQLGTTVGTLTQLSAETGQAIVVTIADDLAGRLNNLHTPVAADAAEGDVASPENASGLGSHHHFAKIGGVQQERMRKIAIHLAEAVKSAALFQFDNDRPGQLNGVRSCDNMFQLAQRNFEIKHHLRKAEQNGLDEFTNFIKVIAGSTLALMKAQMSLLDQVDTIVSECTKPESFRDHGDCSQCICCYGPGQNDESQPKRRLQ